MVTSWYKQFDTLTELISDIIFWELDTNGIITYISRGVERVLGIPTEEVIGKSVYSFIAKEYIENLANVRKDLLSGKSTYTVRDYEWEVKGNRIWMTAHSIPKKNVDGEFVGTYGILVRKGDKEYYPDDNVKISIDEKCKIRYVNKNFLNITGYTIDDIYNHHISDILDKVSFEDLKDAKRKIKSKESQKVVVPLLIVSKPIGDESNKIIRTGVKGVWKNGVIIGYNLSGEDVTREVIAKYKQKIKKDEEEFIDD